MKRPVVRQRGDDPARTRVEIFPSPVVNGRIATDTSRNMSQPPPLTPPPDDVQADGVQPEGEVLHPRRLRLVQILLCLVAMTVTVLIAQPRLMIVVGAVGAGVCLTAVAVSLIPGASFLSIRPDALQVRFLYRDTYYRWECIGSFNIVELRMEPIGPIVRPTERFGLMRLIVWDYAGADMGGRPSWVPDWFRDPERVVARLNAYRNIYAGDRFDVVRRDHGPGA